MNTEFNTAYILYREGEYIKALEILNQVYKWRKTFFGESHFYTTDTQKLIGNIYYKQKKYEEAYLQFQEVYNHLLGFYGHNYSKTLATRSSVASTLKKLRKYEEALKIYSEIYAKRNCILGPTHYDTLHTMSNMAKMHHLLGYNALPTYEEIYKLRKVINPEGIDTLTARSNIAAQLFKVGKYNEALEIFQEIYEIQKTKETMYLNSFHTLDRIASVYSKLGQYNDAMNIYQGVYEKYINVYGEDNLKTLNTYHNIGTLLTHQGKLEEGLVILQEVYSKRKVVLGEEHLETLLTETIIADAYSSLGKFEIALSIYFKIYEIIKRLYPKHEITLITLKSIENVLQKALRPDHPKTLEIQNSIAQELFLNKGNYDDALSIYSKVDEIQVKCYGPEHHITLDTQSKIAAILICQKKYDAAEKLYLEIYDKSAHLGEWHPANLTLLHNRIILKVCVLEETLSSQLNIAAILECQKKMDATLQIYQEVYNKSVIVFGKQHPTTLAIQQNINHLTIDTHSKIPTMLACQEKYETSLQIYQDVYNKSVQVLGENNPANLAIKADINLIKVRVLEETSGIIACQKKINDALKMYKEL